MTHLSFIAEDVHVVPQGKNSVMVYITADVDSILSEIPISEVVKYFGDQELLEQLDIEDIKKYLGEE